MVDMAKIVLVLANVSFLFCIFKYKRTVFHYSDEQRCPGFGLVKMALGSGLYHHLLVWHALDRAFSLQQRCSNACVDKMFLRVEEKALFSKNTCKLDLSS